MTLLTEDEAREKWCPKVRHWASDTSVACNRHDDYQNSEYSLCIASDCMAWRWAKGSNDVGGIKRIDPEDSRPIGYCGAFGRPE